MKIIFLDLGKQPLANDFRLKGKNEFYNDRVILICRDCALCFFKSN